MSKLSDSPTQARPHKRDHTFKIRLLSDQCDLWPVSRKPRKLFGPGKQFLKLRLAHSVKLVFSYVVKGRKIKITAKFRALRRLRFEDTKRTMSPEMGPKSFGTFEKTLPVQLPLLRHWKSQLLNLIDHSRFPTLPIAYPVPGKIST